MSTGMANVDAIQVGRARNASALPLIVKTQLAVETGNVYTDTVSALRDTRAQSVKNVSIVRFETVFSASHCACVALYRIIYDILAAFPS